MRVNFSEIPSDFKQKSEGLADNTCILVSPKDLGATWNTNNLIFRSSIWEASTGKPVSLGLKKFFNIGEKPELAKPPTFPCNIFEKCDGSCIIVSSYRGDLIVRTRNTFSCEIHANGKEIMEWVKSRPLIESFARETESSLIFEALDPKQRIVVDNGPKLNLVLLNVISHKDYSYMDQNGVDFVAKLLQVDRPKRYNFSSLEEVREFAKDLVNFEGWCFYFDNDQEILKLKTGWYLEANRFRFNCPDKLELIKTLIDSGAKSREELLKTFEKEFDFEVLSKLDTDWLFEAKEKLDSQIQKVEALALTIKDLSSKERARAIYRFLPQSCVGLAFEALKPEGISNKAKVSRLKDLVKVARQKQKEAVL